MKASDYIIRFFEERGVDTVFGYIGGMITHLVDSASRSPRLRFVQTYHEQTAAFAAEGYARIKRIPGVAMATSGPGALNMVTGIGNAYFDSIPVVYVTGQVNTREYKYDKPVRQRGFQETDVVSLVRPITKHAVLIDSPENLRYELEKAWHLARNGRKGPVLLDIPMDVQRAEIDPGALAPFLPEPRRAGNAARELEPLLEAFSRARRPLALIGGGCAGAGLEGVLLEWLRKGMPMACSLQGKGVLPENEGPFLGMLGSYGNRCANLAAARSDAILALGSRLDTRQTGNQKEAFSAGKTIYHIDIDPAELKHSRIPNRVCWNGALEEIGGALRRTLRTLRIPPEWKAEIARLKENYSAEREIERFVENPAPYRYMQRVGQIIPDKAVICVDIGQNQMWAAQTLRPRRGQKFLTSGGMAPMGYALPAAIGAAMAGRGETPVTVITGDGGLQMAMQSLLLISQHKLPISVLVFNNRSLGMITQFQTLYFQSNYAATTAAGGYLVPDLRALARSFGLAYHAVSRPEDLPEKLDAGLWDLRISGRTLVSPKLEYNQPNYNMTPFLPEEELARIMAGETGRGKAGHAVRESQE